MNDRIKKVNSLIKRELGKIIHSYLQEENFSLVTVTNVITSSDLYYADIFLNIFDKKEGKKLLDFLKRNIYHIQKELDKKLVLKYVPQIRFKIDKTQDFVDRIENLIEKAKEK
ncbi:ribosome-binding factor A [bacterium (Candidatus Torokbacteria) CG_4_10_14_0_2_um_filter_35_8]|nr:MAG: ribosome-binding factor A [bacterium (Candidatus Torokbacteria) CG_4_10_14_0_2_um_filter_35_8]